MHDTGVLDETALLSMTWADLLFAHWPVDPEVVDARLPRGLSVDTDGGTAYLGVVPFRMEDIRPRGFPIGLSFGELNLRTYVVDEDGTPGVYFFNLDADDRLGVLLARTLFQLPYYRAEMDVRREDGEVHFRARRTHRGAPAARFEGRYGPVEEPTVRDPESLEAFLTERYRFYTSDDAGTIYYGDIDHEPWKLAPAHAEITSNTLFEANGFARPDSEPIYHYCPRIEVTAGRLHRA
ncbi:YqjF family protein [Natronomonas sp. EA1]|uniref:YqjF family protein n=1 Tax=Natronomonas sp. EA1 TaxID=3421655 RepID=UPI003EB732C8